MNNLSSLRIVVVGAGGLLGVKLVRALLIEGAQVIAADINISVLKQTFGDLIYEIKSKNLILRELNIIDSKSIKEFFADEKMLDGAVNVTYPRSQSYGKHFFEVEVDGFNENMALHLGSMFLFTQQCAAYFTEHRLDFSLVNIASIYGCITPNFEIYEGTSMTVPVEYAAIKSATIHTSKYVAKYVNDSAFRVNTVSPGGIFDDQPESFLGAYRAQTLGKGMLDAEDVCGAIIFLLSGGSKFVNGQNIIVDDGFSL
jgi:NAD(P)-dependent dehydrogenase (short-subunit alcohol dehydrogenase family)